MHEQGVDPDIEVDGRDPQCRHVLVRDAAGCPIATGRLFADGRIGRMAVLASHRGRGAGKAALDALLADAVARGMTRLTLNAQESALGFYLRNDFVITGEAFHEAGIRHLPMAREIASSQR